MLLTLFVVCFALFVGVLTMSENIFVLLLLTVGLIGILIVRYVTLGQNFLIKKYVIVLCVAFILATCAVAWKQYRYIQQLPSFYPVETIYTDVSSPQGTLYVGSGMIDDRYSEGRYVFHDEYRNAYFLYSDNDYHIGDIVWINGYVQPGYTGMVLLRDTYSQLQLLPKQLSVADISYAFDYPKWLFMKGYVGTIYEQNSIVIDESSLSLIQRMRRGLYTLVTESYGKTKIGGLLLGLLIGDRSLLPVADYQMFIDSGLVHIIAVSGGNIIMLVVFLGFILFRVPFYLRNFIILCCVILYALICGLDASVLRATVMGSLGLIALFRGREINIWRSLAVAFVSMLLINPYFLLYDVGFLLSFGAVVGIVYVSKWGNGTLTPWFTGMKEEKIENNRKRREYREGPESRLASATIVSAPSIAEQGSIDVNPALAGLKGIQYDKNSVYIQGLHSPGKHKLEFSLLLNATKKLFHAFVRNYLLPTIGATLGVLPFLLFFMEQINIAGIVANMFVVPLIPAVMIYGGVSTVLFQWIDWQWLLRIEEILIQYIFIVANITAQYGLYLIVQGQRFAYALLIIVLLRFVWDRISSLKTSG